MHSRNDSFVPAGRALESSELWMISRNPPFGISDPVPQETGFQSSEAFCLRLELVLERKDAIRWEQSATGLFQRALR
jgi:hypothetical protein